MHPISKSIIFFICVLMMIAWAADPGKPVVYLIGDSTVKNGSGKGSDSLWGWGSFFADHFDTSKITIQNHAIGGRNTRTFRFHDRWNKILQGIKPGDYVFIQFGHNDGAAVVSRAYGSLRGNGADSMVVERDSITHEMEVVHTYGWYIRQYILETKQKGATPIVLSMVPRNIWKDGKVLRADSSYGKWAAETAAQEGAVFINLNDITAKKYEMLGPEKVKAMYFPGDHTHTNKAGAMVNASSVAEGIRMANKFSLQKYLKPGQALANASQ